MKILTNNLAILYRGDPSLQKSETPVLEKGGEGSKCGRVIGHTKSGKPIYQNSIHTSSDFTAEDHSDAMTAHMKEAKEYSTTAEKKRKLHSDTGDDFFSNSAQKDDSKTQHHSSMAELHSKAMNDKLDQNSSPKSKESDSTHEHLKSFAKEHRLKHKSLKEEWEASKDNYDGDIKKYTKELEESGDMNYHR